MRSRLYRGTLGHHRGGAVKNNFDYPVVTACLDLDELAELDRKLRLFSLEGRNLYSLSGVDYALGEGVSKPSERPEPSDSLAARAGAVFSRADLDAPVERVELVTQPRVAGFVFNPVSFFLGYSATDDLVGVIAEINNTYDQTFAYLLDNRNRIDSRAGEIAFATDKRFFVSPFIGDQCDYVWRFAQRRDPDELDIRMKLSRQGRGFFAARLRGTRRKLSDRSLLGAFARFGSMPALIWLRIHLQALRLRALGLQYRRPVS